MNIKIKLDTLSPLLSSSGESTAHIDADVKYDVHGFPYLQARTFKGLFRESAQEVFEILGEDEIRIKALLGDKGNHTGRLRFNNFYIENYAEIINCLQEHKNHLLAPSFVKDHFTEYRRQTKIGEHGIAEDKSLRTYRLIQAGITMETVLENVEEADIPFIQKVLSNIRYMGTRRNRGFGKVRLTSDYDDTSPTEKPTNNNAPPIHSLSYQLTTLDDVVIAKVIGEQNTVNTAQYIPSTAIRGLVAQLIDTNGNKKHTDDFFKNAILSGNVRYLPAFLQGTEPIARVFGYDKTQDTEVSKAEALNLFENNAEIIENNTLKGIGGFVKKGSAIAHSPQTVYSFHSKRMDDRVAGRSTENKGAIFYYEAIEKGQVFEGEILSDNSTLKALSSLLAGVHHIGKSKTAQYAKVKINIKTDNDSVSHITDVKAGESRYLVFQSPIITYNTVGIAIPSLSAILHELTTAGIQIQSHEFIASTEYIESFMGIWQEKTPRELAYTIGSTLKIVFLSDTDASVLQAIEKKGLGERIAEGYGAIKWKTLTDTLPRKLEPKDDTLSKSTFEGFDENAPQLLKSLWAQQKEIERLNENLTEAVESASKVASKISNSLASRLLEALQSAIEKGNGRDNEVLNEWKAFLTHIKDKKQGKKLKEVPKWDKIYGLTNGTEYWLTFFKTLRTKNKS